MRRIAVKLIVVDPDILRVRYGDGILSYYLVDEEILDNDVRLVRYLQAAACDHPGGVDTDDRRVALCPEK